MTKYTAFIKYAVQLGYSEQNVLEWFASSEIEGLRECDRDMLIDLLLTGIKIDKKYVSNVLNKLNDEEFEEYKVFFKNYMTRK